MYIQLTFISNLSANLPALLKLFTHVGFLMPEQKTVSMMAMVNPSVFNYQMTFKDSFSLTQYLSTRPDIDFGPIHADDLYYQVLMIYKRMMTLCPPSSRMFSTLGFLTLLTIQRRSSACQIS